MPFSLPDTLLAHILVGLAGLVILVVCADIAVSKLVLLAEYLGLSTTFVGMTVVSLATSIPEISSHITASVGILSESLDRSVASSIVLGANIGSDVVQQTLILGLVVFIAGGLRFRRYFLLKSLAPMIGTALVCLLLGLDRSYSRLDGAILFLLFVGYTYYLYQDERRHYQPEAPIDPAGDPPGVQTRGQAWGALAIVLGTMVLTVGAAQVVLLTTEWIVDATGIGGSLIGVVTLGVASALPELTTALSGLRKQAHGISLGTLVGSNITNPLVGIGLGALVSTYWVPRPLIVWDLPWQAGSGAILLAFLTVRNGRIGRIGSAYFVLMYALYIGVRMLYFAVD